MRVAAIQAEPVWLDLQGGVDKVCRLIKEAADQGCKLVGFPEVFIPGYPHALFTKAPDTEFVLRYQKNSLVVNSPEYNKIRRACRDAGIWAVVGFSERERSTLYLAQSYINPAGDVVLHRRKIKPTHAERYLWGDAVGPTIFNVVSMDNGARLGALNCWEHMQPLLRYHEYIQGVEVHVASWPHLAYAGEGLPYANSAEASGDIMSRMMAMEGTTFVLVCTAMTTREGSRAVGVEASDEATATGAPLEGGGFTAIYSPTGDVLARAKDQYSEELVIADLELDDIHRARQMADCAGHYSRPDLLSLNVNARPSQKVEYSDGRADPAFIFDSLE